MTKIANNDIDKVTAITPERITAVTPPPPEDGVDHKRPGVAAVASELRQSGEAEPAAGPPAHHTATGGGMVSQHMGLEVTLMHRHFGKGQRKKKIQNLSWLENSTQKNTKNHE